MLTRAAFNNLLNDRMADSFMPEVILGTLETWVDIHARYVATIQAPPGMLTVAQFNAVLTRQELEQLPPGATPRSLDAWWDLYREFQNQGERPMATEKISAALSDPVKVSYFYLCSNGKESKSGVLSGPPIDTGNFQAVITALVLPEGWMLTVLNRL